MKSEESVGMADDNMGPSTTASCEDPLEASVPNSEGWGFFSGSNSQEASEFDSG
jgi:hypothetical protein